MNRFPTIIDALNAAPADRLFVTFWVDEDEQESVTFGEFRDRARAQAAFLSDRGVTSGDRVVIIMPQGIPAMTAFAGTMMLGAVPAILAYPNFKVEPLKYRSGLAGVTANLSAKAVLIDADFPEELAAYVSCTDQTQLLRMENVHVPARNTIPSPNDRAANLAFIQHSAGTTGLQKGVALTHEAVLIQLHHLAEALKIDEGHDRIYNWLPLYHDMGLISCFMLPMVCHLPVIMQSPLDWVMHPETMLEIIGEHRCTLAWLPNFAFQFTARRIPESRRHGFDLSSVRALINCSEPVRSSSMREFQEVFSGAGLQHRALQSSYAMAENVFAVTQSAIAQDPQEISADALCFRAEHIVREVSPQTTGAISFTSSGKLLPGQEVRIVSDSGAPLADGRVGEILIRSDCLFQGYYNRPDLTAEALVNGWYRSGDLGFQLRGELFVVGRKKDLLIVGGENLYPQDIEEVVSTHPAIHDGRAIAVGIYNPELGTEDVVVVAEVEREQQLARAEQIDREIRAQVVAALGVAVRRILLKPPKWIVKSTAGKPARSATREKLLREHPEFTAQSEESQLA